MEDTDKINAEIELDKQLSAPLTEDEAKKELADIDVKRAQLNGIRQGLMSEIQQAQLAIATANVKVSMVEDKLAELGLKQAVVFRRVLNGHDKE